MRKPETPPAKRTRINRRLDELDVRLLRQLLQGEAMLPLNPQFRRSFRKVARVLKVDEDTVRHRIRRLDEIGFVRGWGLVINPRVLGFNDYAIWFDVSTSVPKQDLIEKVKLLPGIFIMINSYGTMLALMIRYDTPDSLSKEIELIQQLSKASNVTQAIVPWPECLIGLNDDDMRILWSVSKDPRKTYVQISKELHLSARTIQRRLDRMIQSRLLFEFCSINPKALEGTVMADLCIAFSPQFGLTIERGFGEIDPYIFHTFHLVSATEENTHYFWINLALPNIAKVAEVLDSVKGLPGVRSARVELKQDHRIFLEVLREELKRRMVQIQHN